MPPIANSLTADQLNYLIWRYLQEQGHGKAAATLQRDWRSGEHPDKLPFAKNIKRHDLIRLVHKGLLYYDHEQAVLQSQRNIPARPFFQDEVERATSVYQTASDDETTTNLRTTPQARKHARESTANGLGLDIPTSAPAAKRVRRSHGGGISTNGDVMDVDDGEHEQSELPEPVSRSHSPGVEDCKSELEMDMERHAPEPARMTPTLANGQSVGVQSDRVAELVSETTLTVPDGKHVIHTAWNPRDPHILAVAGEALCRIWNLAKRPPTSSDPLPEYHDLLGPFETALVTTIAWSPDGEILAMATKDTQKAAFVQIGLVSLFSKRGRSIDELPFTDDGIIAFRWSPSGRYLLGIISSGATESTLVVWDIASPETKAYYRLDGIVRDAAWTNKSHFMVCGHELIAYFAFDGQNITLVRSRAENERRCKWSHLRFDSATQTAAVAAEYESVLAIINSSDELVATSAHEEEITALEYRPMTNSPSLTPSGRCLLATSALDGKIKLWDAQKPFDIVTTLELGRETPPMAICFPPDGRLVAAAGWNRILIWDPENSTTPKACWRGETGQWQGHAANGLDQDSGIGEEDEQIPQHSLSWDGEGAKLAYGLRNEVAILDIRSLPTS